MSAAAALLLWVGAVPLPPLRPHLPPSSSLSDRGAVTLAVGGGGYVDRGAADGLEAGDALELLRKGRTAARCTVGALADHSAFCAGARLERGDTFRLARRPPRSPEGKALPPLPSDSELERRAATLARAELPPVEYAASGLASPAAKVPVSAGFRHTTWASSSAPASSFHLEQLDLALRAFEPVPDWRVSVSLSVWLYAGRPQEPRDPARSAVRLHVRELQLEWDGRQRPWRVAFGRVWARGAPGLSSLDGLLAAWRGVPGLEVGGFAGLLAEPLTFGVSTERWTVGLFQAWEWHGAGRLRWFRQSVRAAAVGRPEPRGELEVMAQAALSHPLDAEAAVRVGIGDGVNGLDLARLALTWRPIAKIAVQLSGRYTGYLPYDVTQPLAPATGVPALHVGGTAGWELISGLVVSARAGFARDFNAQLSRAFVGPELAAPRLFAGKGGVRLGWLEEAGHLGARSVWLAADYAPLPRARAWARLGWTQQAPAMGTGDHVAHELTLQAAVELVLPLGLAAQTSLLVHHGLGAEGPGGDRAVRQSSTSAFVWQAGASWSW
ncbi:MAG: hypothetical protein IPJ65_14440 [Archangiaceae bacterium]|nr:hypothetical protein [Archangiaceae bacterium]